MKSREVPDKNMPKYWLAMSDAAAFNLAQSALALASKLRTEIAGQTRITPALHASEIAVLLLSAAEGAWGKGMSDRLVKEIIGQTQLNSMNLAKIYLLVYRTMSLLPETAWDAKKLIVRQDLLAELRKRGCGLQPAMPTHSIKEEIAEQKWLRQLRETGASVGHRKQGAD